MKLLEMHLFVLKVEKKLNLHNLNSHKYRSVFQAELNALKQAVEWCIDKSLSALICSESQVTLNCIKDKYNMHMYGVNIRSSIANSGKHISLNSDISENEKVDQLAKLVCSLDIADRYRKISVSFINNHFKNLMFASLPYGKKKY